MRYRSGMDSRTASRLGIGVQAIAIAALFMARDRSRGLFDSWGAFNPFLLPGATLLVVAAVAIFVWAKRTLKREWSFSARLVDDHRLVTTGPYAYVRHPIYVSLLLYMIAIGFAVTAPIVLAPALVVYFVGVAIRIRAEESLLRERFGAAFEDYRRRVPAIIPFT